MCVSRMRCREFPWRPVLGRRQSPGHDQWSAVLQPISSSAKAMFADRPALPFNKHRPLGKRHENRIVHVQLHRQLDIGTHSNLLWHIYAFRVKGYRPDIPKRPGENTAISGICFKRVVALFTEHIVRVSHEVKLMSSVQLQTP